ncbi:MAG: hypothetical protein GY841_07340 [FCB group bacterium]|nr:hypothetical protein [FCB group bacterium]
MDISAPKTSAYDGPVAWLDRPQAAVINSRQSKFPLGTDSWVAATCRAIASLSGSDHVVLTSLGMNTWELTLMLAAQYNLPTIVITVAAPEARREFEKQVISRFRLEPDRVGFLFLPETAGKGPKGWWPARDMAVFDLADMILPISIRPRGTLNSLLALHRSKIDQNYTVAYKKNDRHRPNYDGRSFSSALANEEWLIHFTRSSGSPWPGESAYDFYGAIIASGEEYCHSARSGLLRILRRKIIYGSSRNIRGGFRVVGFSAVNPDMITRLFRYRSRLLNSNFEPFGIALPKAKAHALDLRPVIYGRPELYPQLDSDNQPFFQSEGSRGGIWRGENEWRFYGDFKLETSTVEVMRIVVPDKKAAESVKHLSSAEIITLFSG